jgi:hypothetical protein
MRLAGCAFCRSIWHLIDDEAARNAVETAERYADGEASRAELKAAYTESAHVTSAANKAASGTADCPFSVAFCAEVATCAADAFAFAPGATEGAYLAESRRQSHLLRCIFGNPFRPVAFDPAWRTSDVVLLAQGIYDERAFDRMPILADALQDAGCTNDDILAHCRDANTPHARGCWVVDLVLGKA